MSVWSHIILEGYCMFDSSKNKKKTVFELDIEALKQGEFITKNEMIIDNTGYIDALRPNWCQEKYSDDEENKVPNFDCLCDPITKKKCPFFAFCNADSKEYEVFEKAFKEMPEDEEDEFDQLSDKKLIRD